MKKLTFILLLISSGAMGQSIQGWVGSPYYFNLENQLNYQVGAIFKINTNNNYFGLGVEYATKNVSDNYEKSLKYQLPQLNIHAQYEYRFLFNEQNQLGLKAGAICSFMNTNSYQYISNSNQTIQEDLAKGTGILARGGLAYYRVLNERISLFAEVFGQYKIKQDLGYMGSTDYTRMKKSPKDYFSAGLNLGVDINLKK